MTPQLCVKLSPLRPAALVQINFPLCQFEWDEDWGLLDLADSPPSAVPALLYRPTVDLIGAMETQSEPSELELDDVVITNPHIEAILENEDWIEDASYVLLGT